jgi:sulfhydrogenase subunit beta (sulfur reductase)
MAKIITEIDLEELIHGLTKEYRVIASQKKNNHAPSGEFCFAEVEPNTKLGLNYGTTILPPKEFLLPPSDILFGYDDSKVTTPGNEKTILFGLNLEDLEGVHLLTKVFEKPVNDIPYAKRKESTIVVGLDRFSPPKDIPFDLYLMHLPGERFSAYAGSAEGQKILKSRLFKSQSTHIPVVKKRKDDLLWDPEMWRAIEKSKSHPVWKELAEICFGCGICSYTCPLCYCFETEDTVEMGTGDKPKGARCRTWDSCMLSHFAETTAGNFRPELADRIYNWYFHKFVRMPAEHGFPGCTDCNRCTIYCPAKINYRSVLERVLRDYQKKGGK